MVFNSKKARSLLGVFYETAGSHLRCKHLTSPAKEKGMKCEHSVQPRAFIVNESICFPLSGSSAVARITKGLLVTKTYLYHWLYIFAQFWTRLYCSTTIKCFLSVNEFKTESSLCNYMSKQGTSFSLGRAGLCVIIGGQVEGNCASPLSPFLLQFWESLSSCKFHSIHFWFDIMLTNIEL